MVFFFQNQTSIFIYNTNMNQSAESSFDANKESFIVKENSIQVYIDDLSAIMNNRPTDTDFVI